MPYGKHPHYESARERQRRQARDRVAAYLDRCARLRARWQSGRILESVAGV